MEGFSSDKSKVVVRHAAPLNHVSLTSIVIPKLPFGMGSAALKKKWEEAKVEETFNESAYAKTRAKMARRKTLSDFERFKVMVLRKQVCVMMGMCVGVRGGGWRRV